MRRLNWIAIGVCIVWAAGASAAESIRFDFDPSHLNPVRDGAGATPVLFTVER